MSFEPPSYTCHLRVPAWLVPELLRRAQRCRVLPDAYLRDLVVTALAVSNAGQTRQPSIRRGKQKPDRLSVILSGNKAGT
jgi:hypothetical protein